jgi:cysteine synthase A
VAILDTVLEAIGNTPMVRLRRIPEQGDAEILVKLESLNPGGSIKARPAYRIISEPKGKERSAQVLS